MHDLAEDYGADLLRYEGDGLWLKPCDRHARTQNHAAMENAVEMARLAIDQFDDFTAAQDIAFKGAKLKAVLELGEIEAYHWAPPSHHTARQA